MPFACGRGVHFNAIYYDSRCICATQTCIYIYIYIYIVILVAWSEKSRTHRIFITIISLKMITTFVQITYIHFNIELNSRKFCWSLLKSRKLSYIPATQLI
jgi:hypothetical protein